MSEKIKDLQAVVAKREAQLAEARKELREAQVAEAGVSVGDIVRSTESRTGGQVGRVVKIDPGHRPAWVTVNPRKNDGQFGKAERNWFSYWERVPASAPSTASTSS